MDLYYVVTFPMALFPILNIMCFFLSPRDWHTLCVKVRFYGSFRKVFRVYFLSPYRIVNLLWMKIRSSDCQNRTVMRLLSVQL